MATITSVGSGLWSAAGTWDAGVPVDNDTVIIASGHTVEFDVDQSGFANGINGLTVTGTFKMTRTAGTYYFKLKTGTTITATGTFDFGTAVSPIPFTAKHTFACVSGTTISGCVFTCFGAEPTIKYVKLTEQAAVGATVFSVDTDVTGDIWEDGDTIFTVDIMNWMGRTNDQLTIAAGGITANTITVTAPIAQIKPIGSHIALVTRNPKILNVGFTTMAAGNMLIGGGYFSRAAGTFAGANTYVTMTGGLITHGNNGYVGLAAPSFEMSGGVLLDTTNGFYACSSVNVTGGYFFGRSSGNLCNSSNGHQFANMYIAPGQYVVRSCIGIHFSNCIIANPMQVFALSATGTLTNCVVTNGLTLWNASSVNMYNTLTTGTGKPVLFGNSDINYSESIIHDQVAGNYKSWTRGGITTTVATPVPSGYTSALQIALSSATSRGYTKWEVTVGAGASVNIGMYLRKSASMAVLPKFEVSDKSLLDPFLGGTALYTFTMTDSINTWESDTYTYTNTSAGDVTLIVRAIGMNASGNVYCVADIEQINVDLTNAIAKIDVIDGLVDAIKAKTDQLAFTVANQVDANALTGGASPADVADAVWDEAIEDHVAAGSFGAKNQKVVPSETLNDYKADVSGLATSVSLATVDSVVDVIKLKTDNLPADPASEATVNTRLATSGYTAPPSVSDIVTGVWSATTRTLSSFGTLIADVWGYATRTLSAFGFTVSATPDANVALIKAKTDNLPASPAAVGSAMTLTAGERTAIANEVESQIINEADAERVLTAITDKIASVNPSLDDLTLAGIASAVRTELGTELARIDAAISSRLATSGYTAPANADVAAIKAKTDNLPSDPADQSILASLIAGLPAAPSVTDIINALKASVFDGLLTFEDSIRLYNAILFGKLDGGGTGILKFRDPADTKDRVTAVVDLNNGDRDDITLDLT